MRIGGHAEFSRVVGVDELDDDVFAYALYVAIAPLLEGIRRCRSAALLGRTPICAAGGMIFDLVGRSVGDVSASAIGLPSGQTGEGCEVFIGVCDAAIVLFLEFVLGSSGRGIAAQPELLDKLFALLIVGQ